MKRENKMKRMGFFGGSFNPPTYAHINIAKASIEKLGLDKFFFVPVGNLYNKPDLIDEVYRYDMLKIACKNENNIFVEDIELKKSRNLSALEVFEMIENKYKRDNDIAIFFVMGADNFIKLPNWKNAKELITKYQYIIFERNNSNLRSQIEENELLNKNKFNFHILKLEDYSQISSGNIRTLIKNNDYEKCKEFTKPEIIEYIKMNKLY